MGREALDSGPTSSGALTPALADDAKPKIDLKIDWTSVNLDEVILPEGDDLGIPSDNEEDELEVVEHETGLGNIIVIDNLPVVPPEKAEKLQTVIRKIFGQIGEIREGGLFMPLDEESKKTKGFAFIEYLTPQEAQAARDQTDGYKLDKSHVFKVSMFDDFEKFARVPDEYVPPAPEDYKPSENLQSWLMDERARDQFVVRHGSDTEVFWNDVRQGKPELVYSRKFWTELFVQWSPLGSYLATVHRQGAAIWGGPSWNRTRFAHPQVRLIDFSPAEKFLVTFSSQEPANPRDTQRVTLNVFETRSGKSLRKFEGPADDFFPASAAAAGMQWPIFRWAGGKEDKYFARLGKNCISIYETVTMGLLDKKSLKVDGVQDFSWSPAEPLLALFVPEAGGGNQPARVSLYQIPGKTEVRQKNLFSVSDCKMFWQNAGEYLAVKVDRYTKTKKTVYSGFELFRLKERDIPIEVMELENKNDKIIDFAWEPHGHRFAIIHGDGPKPDVSIFSMKATTPPPLVAGKGDAAAAATAAATSSGVQKVVKLTTLKARQANSLHWSPAGRFLLIAGLKGFNGQLEFFNVDDLETTATAEHFTCTDIEWDPTGRYVATSVTSVHQTENGFNVWSFLGKLLYALPYERFYQFLWRPRPPSLISPEKEGEIAKSLRKYSKKYEAEDEVAGAALSQAEVERRLAVMEQWRAYVASWRRAEEEEKPLRIALLKEGGMEEEEEEEYKAEEVEVEEIIDIQEEVMGFEKSDYRD